MKITTSTKPCDFLDALLDELQSLNQKVADALASSATEEFSMLEEQYLLSSKTYTRWSNQYNRRRPVEGAPYGI